MKINKVWINPTQIPRHPHSDDKPMGFAAQYAENAASRDPIEDKMAISIKYMMGHKLPEKAITRHLKYIQYPIIVNCWTPRGYG